MRASGAFSSFTLLNSGVTICGCTQFTPSASRVLLRLDRALAQSELTASLNSSPLARCRLSLHWNEIQNRTLGYSSHIISNSAAASILQGIVSIPSTSTPASIHASILGRCHFWIVSGDTVLE
uniref:Putative secreted protein n=1 Tax=Anopheles triannulatus TaxID=58253 RepID=A0A2M4B406_9DIPT